MNAQTPQCQNPKIDISNCYHLFELWTLNFDISFGWGLRIVFVKMVAGFFVIL